MIWIAHSVFLIVFAAFLLANRLKVETREEFSVLPSFEKEKIFKRVLRGNCDNALRAYDFIGFCSYLLSKRQQ